MRWPSWRAAVPPRAPRLPRPAGSRATRASSSPDEIALALTLTRRAAGVELSLAIDLAYLPATAATLEAGQIDLIKARIIAEGSAAWSPRTRPRWKPPCCPRRR